MPHLDTWVVSSLLIGLGSMELLAGRMLNRRQTDELAVDIVSLAQFALLIKPMIIAIAALALTQWAPGWAGSLASMPLWQAVLLIVIPADFMHYWYHRLGHTLPVMWRMHRTHHTATAMSAYSPAAEKTSATSRTLPKTTRVPAIRDCSRATMSPRVAILQRCRPASTCRARGTTRGASDAAFPATRTATTTGSNSAAEPAR